MVLELFFRFFCFFVLFFFDGAAGVGDGVVDCSDVGFGVSDDIAGFVAGTFAVLTGEMVAGLECPGLEDFFLRITSVQPTGSFVLGWT